MATDINNELETPNDNIVYNPEAANTKLVSPGESVPDDNTVNKNEIDLNIDDSNSNIVYDEERAGRFVPQDQFHNINVSDYAGDLGIDSDDVFMPEYNGMNVLNTARANDQGFFAQAGNFLGQAVIGEIVGGSIEGLGYMLDLGSIIDIARGEETDWGNFMTNIGQGIRENTQDAMQIHQDPNAQGFSKMLDSGWWFSNSVSVASTLSMLIPTGAAMRAASFIGKGVGVSKGMRSVRKAVGLAEEMGHKGKWMANGLSQAVLSRNIENWMEAHGTFEDMKSQKMSQVDPNTGELYTDEEAIRIASEAASSNYGKGWAMLIQDIPQYLAIGKVFNPASGKMIKAVNDGKTLGLKINMKPWQRKTAKIAKTFFGEAGEESYQYMISEQSKLMADLNAGYITQKEYDDKLSEAFGDEEMLTSAFFGGLGGNAFQAVGGGVNDVFKSKDRKEYESKLESTYADHVKNKAKQVHLAFQHLNSADESGSKEMRDHIINESILNLTVEALENDKFDQFYETLGMVSEMSEEDAKSFEKASGQEFNTELAKQDAPRLQKMSIELRDKYLKHRNRHGKNTSSRLARLETENSRLNKIIQEKIKNTSEIKVKMGSQFDRQASDKLKEKLELRERGQVIKNRREVLKNRLTSANNNQKPFIQAAIDSNEREYKKHSLDSQLQRQSSLDRTAQEKETDKNRAEDDKAAEDLYNRLYKENILEELNSESRAKEQIIINNEDMAFSISEGGKNLAKVQRLEKEFNKYDNIEDTNEAIKKIKDLKDNIVPGIDYMDEAELAEFKEKVDKKMKSLDLKLRNEKARVGALLIEKEKLERDKANNEDIATPNNVNALPVEDNIEDSNAEENPISNQQQQKAHEDLNLKQTKGSGFIALLDQINDNDGNSVTPGYDEWMSTPFDKVGSVFKYTADVDNNSLNSIQKEAIKVFKNLKPGEEVPQVVLDYLPIKATFDKSENVFTFLATKPGKNKSEKEKVDYDREYKNERSSIIDKLIAGEEALTKAALNTGGDLQLDYDQEEESGSRVPEYLLTQLKQIGFDMSKIELLVTNEKGYLMNVETKDQDKDLGNRPILLDKKSNGSKLPYAGGVFLKVKMANGKPFALRLNLKKNTEDQATLLSKILLQVGVTTPELNADDSIKTNDKGTYIVSKKLKLSTPLSRIDPDFKDEILRVMGPEVSALDKEFKDPTIVDLIDSFVYMSSKTLGKTSALALDGNDLVFGKHTATMKTRDSEDTKNNLIDFLMNNKRRQFKISMWNENQDYKNFIIENGILSTDGAIDRPLFMNTARRNSRGDMVGKRIQLYMNPISSKNETGTVKKSNGDIALSNEAASFGEGATMFSPETMAKLGMKSPAEEFSVGLNKIDEKPKQKSNQSLTKDVVFDSANGEQVAWDESSQVWVKKIDESMAISEETNFKKDGFTYSHMDYMPADQQYQKQNLSTGKVIYENITKEEYEDAKGNLDDNPFRVEEISFKEAKRLYEYSQQTQQTGDPEISKPAKNVVSSEPVVSKGSEVAQTFLTFNEDVIEDDSISEENDGDLDFSDFKMGNLPTNDTTPTDEVRDMKDGKVETKCAKSKK